MKNVRDNMLRYTEIENGVVRRNEVVRSWSRRWTVDQRRSVLLESVRFSKVVAVAAW